MGQKKDIIYKICMAVAIAVFVIALYFNNDRVIENISNTRKERSAANAASTTNIANTSGTDSTVGGAKKDAEPEANNHDGGNASNDTIGSGSSTTNRSFNFTLHNGGGDSIEFNEYRGNIVVITFWSPSIDESIRQLDSIKEAYANNGYTGVSLIAVRAPGDDAGVYPAVGEYSDLFDEYNDAGEDLARLFLINEYPSTYVFKQNGELCDYQKGYIDPARIDRMVSRANEPDHQSGD